MKFTKEPPYSLGELACIVNAMIDVLKLDVPKLTEASISKINNALISIVKEYRSTMELENQWKQTVDFFERRQFDDKTRERILEKADKLFEHLKRFKDLK